MPNKSQGRIIGESFREVNRRRRSRRGIRENFHRLSGHCWLGVTIVASLSKCHLGQTTLFAKPFNLRSESTENRALTPSKALEGKIAELLVN